MLFQPIKSLFPVGHELLMVFGGGVVAGRSAEQGSEGECRRRGWKVKAEEEGGSYQRSYQRGDTADSTR